MNIYIKNIEKLEEFKRIYSEYLTTGSAEHRQSLNELTPVISKIFREAGIPGTIHYAPPPATGGLAGQIDLLANLFNLRQFSIRPQMIIDNVDRAIGTNKFYFDQLKWKRFNPIWWIGQFIRLPFKIIKWAGFNGAEIESSIIGKSYKAAAGVAAFVASIIKIWEFLGKKVPAWISLNSF